MIEITIAEPPIVDICIVSEDTVEVDIGSELVRLGDYEEYQGPFSIEPAKHVQKLPTSDKYVSRDITVKQVPYAEVSNNAGGKTVIIG